MGGQAGIPDWSLWPRLRLAPTRADLIMARSWNAPTREAEDTSAVRPSLSRSGWPWRRRRQATIYFSLDGGVQIGPDRVGRRPGPGPSTRGALLPPCFQTMCQPIRFLFSCTDYRFFLSYLILAWAGTVSFQQWVVDGHARSVFICSPEQHVRGAIVGGIP